MTDLTDEIRIAVRERVFAALGVATIDDHEDYIGRGLLNSLFAIELVTSLEHRFGFSLSHVDLDVDNFRSIDALTRLVVRKIDDAAAE